MTRTSTEDMKTTISNLRFDLRRAEDELAETQKQFDKHVRHHSEVVVHYKRIIDSLKDEMEFRRNATIVFSIIALALVIGFSWGH